VVEWERRKLWTPPKVLEERNLLWGKVTRDNIDQEAREVTGSIGHLYHGVIAGGENVDKRTERELDGEVPGNEHSDHTEWLGKDAIAGVQEGQAVDRSAPRSPR
jgi:hypothetical protein